MKEKLIDFCSTIIALLIIFTPLLLLGGGLLSLITISGNTKDDWIQAATYQAVYIDGGNEEIIPAINCQESSDTKYCTVYNGGVFNADTRLQVVQDYWEIEK